MLSSKTINNLANALAPEIIDSIMQDERWVEFLQEVIPDLIVDKMGDVDSELVFDLSMVIMDKISFKAST
jgi:hypothetical protein